MALVATCGVRAYVSGNTSVQYCAATCQTHECSLNRFTQRTAHSAVKPRAVSSSKGKRMPDERTRRAFAVREMQKAP